MDLKPLAGKVALVTGGGKRLGRELALGLAEAGADVVITFRNSYNEAAKTLLEIETNEVRGFVIEMDVRDEQSVSRAIHSTLARAGRLDILINSAAVFETAALDQISLDQWDRVFETNTRGPFLVAREALPYLRASGGRIVNLGSLGAMQSWSTHGHYCASKAALHSLTKTMAKAFAPEVSVNCVAPGWVQMGSGQVDAGRFAARTPMGRNASAADVLEAVLFFATGPNFITGQVLVVDGGLGL